MCLCSETPLSLAVQCEPGGGEPIRVLVDGGAHIDFRAKDGLTSLHKAVRGHRHTALLVNTHNSVSFVEKLKQIRSFHFSRYKGRKSNSRRCVYVQDVRFALSKQAEYLFHSRTKTPQNKEDRIIKVCYRFEFYVFVQMLNKKQP